jgi:peptidoglycan/LPS O-acetylase OafA/YrhL
LSLAVGVLLASFAVALPDPAVVGAAALMIFGLLGDAGMFAAALTAKPLHWLGEISYSIYFSPGSWSFEYLDCGMGGSAASLSYR